MKDICKKIKELGWSTPTEFKLFVPTHNEIAPEGKRIPSEVLVKTPGEYYPLPTYEEVLAIIPVKISGPLSAFGSYDFNLNIIDGEERIFHLFYKDTTTLKTIISVEDSNSLIAILELWCLLKEGGYV